MDVRLSLSALHGWWCQNEQKNHLSLLTLLIISPQFLPSLMSFPGYLKPGHFILESSIKAKAPKWSLLITWLSFFLWIMPRPSCKKTKKDEMKEKKKENRKKDKRWQNFELQRIQPCRRHWRTPWFLPQRYFHQFSWESGKYVKNKASISFIL